MATEKWGKLLGVLEYTNLQLLHGPSQKYDSSVSQNKSAYYTPWITLYSTVYNFSQ
jgi:hypothetical protein